MTETRRQANQGNDLDEEVIVVVGLTCFGMATLTTAVLGELPTRKRPELPFYNKQAIDKTGISSELFNAGRSMVRLN